MAIYICAECGEHKDGDYDPMSENEMCEECHTNMEPEPEQKSRPGLNKLIAEVEADHPFDENYDGPEEE